MPPEFQLRGRIIAPSNEITDGVITIVGDRITTIAEYASHSSPLPFAGTLLPGLVDIHNHGGAGAEFGSNQAESARQAAAYHHRRGTTTLLASLMTAAPTQLIAQTKLLSQLVFDGFISGIHCEGPFLAAARCGAQDPRFLLPPDTQLTGQLIDAAAGTLRVMTLAPELPGFAKVATQLTAHGVSVAIGHTDASHADFRAALAPAGPATLVTHLANAMPPLHHRSPGPIAASLTAAARGSATIELIADGVHVDPGFAEMVCATAPNNVAIISDASAAAGQPDGSYLLGPQRIQVNNGIARVNSGALAGSTGDQLSGLNWLVTACAVPLPAAVAMASLIPARAAGLTDVGDLRPGLLADVLVVDESLTLRRVLRRGRWLT